MQPPHGAMQPVSMQEVTIPLRPVGINETVGHAEDYLKVVQDEYAARCLDMLNISSTSANKAIFLRAGHMMDDCEIQGVWPDLRTSAIADALRIVPPQRQRVGGEPTEADENDKAFLSQWYGHTQQVYVKPPVVGSTLGGSLHGASLGDAEDADSAEGSAAHALAGAKTAPLLSGALAAASEKDTLVQAGGAGFGATTAATHTRSEFAAELERVRQQAGTSHTNKEKEASIDEEARDRLKRELAALKAKFILPFACERSSGRGKRADVVPWTADGPLSIKAPVEMWGEVLVPISVSFEDVQRNTAKFVDEALPLEMLTSREEPAVLEAVREVLRDADVSRLTGLLAHLLHWITLMPLRKEGPQLSESALQSLYVAVYELWSRYEKHWRSVRVGVTLVLPCLMLTIKRGIERCFELSFPTLTANDSLRQQLVDCINSLLMRLFDPDGTYSRFGKFDGTGKAINLSKRLDAMLASQEAEGSGGVGAGTNKGKRLAGRTQRSTPLVRAVLGLRGDTIAAAGDARGARLVPQQGDPNAPAKHGSVVEPPKDQGRRQALLRAALDRLAIHGPDGVPEASKKEDVHRAARAAIGRVEQRAMAKARHECPSPPAAAMERRRSSATAMQDAHKASSLMTPAAEEKLPAAATVPAVPTPRGATTAGVQSARTMTSGQPPLPSLPPLPGTEGRQRRVVLEAILQ